MAIPCENSAYHCPTPWTVSGRGESLGSPQHLPRIVPSGRRHEGPAMGNDFVVQRGLWVLLCRKAEHKLPCSAAQMSPESFLLSTNRQAPVACWAAPHVECSCNDKTLGHRRGGVGRRGACSNLSSPSCAAVQLCTALWLFEILSLGKAS